MFVQEQDMPLPLKVLKELQTLKPNDDLPDGGRGILPDSSMLMAIRIYLNSFCKSLPRRKGPRLEYSCRSFDATALLAFGILLEEAVQNMLGHQGDLVFTESADADDVAAKAAGCHTKRSADVTAGGSAGTAYSTDGYDEMLSIPRAPKRPKVKDGQGGDEITSNHDDESRGECDPKSEPHNQSRQAARQPGTISMARKLLTPAPKRRRLGFFDM
ncbi:putative membrane protein [Ophiocordyceps camponoti-floridani]|uniref:Putative membrane protein n=1 Tax=Ophiocordyceps camponoti-floridani TaxID=2030778 RepID=A0A8H4QA04_9HYPO|nr:putative membrane protein [Ophiocordyceps camponoti-floridani]